VTGQSSQQGSFLGDLQRAVQANPVPAALIGMGALWMLMGGGRTTAAAALVGNALGSVGQAAAPAGDALQQSLGGASEHVPSTIGRAGDAVSDAAITAKKGVADAYQAAADVTGRAAGAVAQATSTLGRSAGSSAVRLGGTVQSNLAETFERQPLLVGAIGIAIGAVIASALPRTRIEEETLGDQAATAKEHVTDFVSDTAEKAGVVAKRVIDAVRDEAQAQGLNPSGVKEGASAIRDKALNAAAAAKTNGRRNSQP